MPFLQSFSINTEQKHPFPYNIAAVKFAKEIELNNSVTIFAGDNGSGKSTLPETLALSLNLPLIGGYITSHDGFEAAGILQQFLRIEWKRQTAKGFFFRAEDFSDFLHSAEREKGKIKNDLSGLKGKVDDSVINRLSESMNFSLHKMREDYGDNMQAFSHGEAYLKILETRITDKGIYLPDEPEAALSPLKQLSLIALILEILKHNNAQFILSTHSPVLMGIPNATIYEMPINLWHTQSDDDKAFHPAIKKQ